MQNNQWLTFCEYITEFEFVLKMENKSIFFQNIFYFGKFDILKTSLLIISTIKYVPDHMLERKLRQ